VPDLGDASDEYSFRMAITFFSLSESHTKVQQDSRCTTILHVDSTFTMVCQKYSVFILDISDTADRNVAAYNQAVSILGERKVKQIRQG
ncbi:hypothetical protein PHMEG_00017768, partial [Phytophthora megakarya]